MITLDFVNNIFEYLADSGVYSITVDGIASGPAEIRFGSKVVQSIEPVIAKKPKGVDVFEAYKISCHLGPFIDPYDVELFIHKYEVNDDEVFFHLFKQLNQDHAATFTIDKEEYYKLKLRNA